MGYPRTDDTSEPQLTVLVFYELSKGDKYGQIGVITGSLIGDLKKDAIPHYLSWISHKSKSPVKSVPDAESFS